jgi:hypothetical protein
MLSTLLTTPAPAPTPYGVIDFTKRPVVADVPLPPVRPKEVPAEERYWAKKFAQSQHALQHIIKEIDQIEAACHRRWGNAYGTHCSADGGRPGSLYMGGIYEVCGLHYPICIERLSAMWAEYMNGSY